MSGYKSAIVKKLILAAFLTILIIDVSYFGAQYLTSQSSQSKKQTESSTTISTQTLPSGGVNTSSAISTRQTTVSTSVSSGYVKVLSALSFVANVSIYDAYNGYMYAILPGSANGIVADYYLSVLNSTAEVASISICTLCQYTMQNSTGYYHDELVGEAYNPVTHDVYVLERVYDSTSTDETEVETVV